MIKVDETDPVGGEWILSSVNGSLSEEMLDKSRRMKSVICCTSVNEMEIVRKLTTLLPISPSRLKRKLHFTQENKFFRL